MCIESSKLVCSDLKKAQTLVQEVGCCPAGGKILAEKMVPLLLKLDNLLFSSANILKQEALSLGIDVAVHRLVASGQIPRSSVIIIGNLYKVKQLYTKLLPQRSFLEFEQILAQIKKYL